MTKPYQGVFEAILSIMGDKTMTQIMEENSAIVMQETFAKIVTGTIQFQNQASKSFLPNDKNPVSNTVLGEKNLIH